MLNWINVHVRIWVVGRQAALSAKTSLAASQLPERATWQHNGCLWGGKRTFDPHRHRANVSALTMALQ